VASKSLIFEQISEEKFQGHSTRKRIYLELEKELKGVPLISFCTSFVYPVIIDDNDADMLEGVLQKCDLKNGFALLVCSPGGDALAAERIVNICRCYSGTGKYTAIVPGKAKSAATMICLGASKILMSRTSELGPIDPQVIIEKKWFSVYNIVKSYEDLFNRSVKEKGNLQPYLQQLSNYDAREIAEHKAALSLSEDIAVKMLKSGMMNGNPVKRIKRQMTVFCVPEKVKVHGRPIYAEEAKECGLNVEIVNAKTTFWSFVEELHIRLRNFVSSNNVVKCIESKDHFFAGRASE
jgi:hypothetical protein